MGAPRGNRGFGSASPEQIAKYVKLHEHLDALLEMITGSDCRMSLRVKLMMHDLLATNIHDAAENLEPRYGF